MDRNVVIATVLIAGILFAWMYFLSPPPPEPGDVRAADDTVTAAPPPAEAPAPEPEAARPSRLPQLAPDSAFAAAQQGQAQRIVVDSDLYRAVFSTKGGTLVSFALKQYNQFAPDTPLERVAPAAAGALGLVFTTPSSHVVDSRTFFFEPSFSGDTLRVGEGGATLTFTTPVAEGAIRQTYTFTPGEYEVGLRVEQTNPQAYSTPEGYELVW
ncbi:MAG: membrane protein insertase YidC, partial [Rhodothermales bacterium]|nr:membrane protein insertase YidC [Rhodothermales bacterium]